MKSKIISSILVSSIFLILGFFVIIRLIAHINLTHSVVLALQGQSLDLDSRVELMTKMKSLAIESFFLIILVIVVEIFIMGVIVSNCRLRCCLEQALYQRNQSKHSSQ